MSFIAIPKYHNFRAFVYLGVLALTDVAMADDGLDIYRQGLEQLLEIKITSSSMFDERELTSSSTTLVVQKTDWTRRGARQTLDALTHLPATIPLPLNAGLGVVALRGYAQITSARGIATTLDGAPLNNFSFGTGQYNSPNINLGVLNRIEVVRGPASALYGSDAFHGVIAYSTSSPTATSQIWK